MSDSNRGTLEPTFFATPAEFRAWLEEHHECLRELWVGFHKKGTGLPSITWPEAVDQALCFGWIDGVRKSLGDSSYMIRFTPRKPGSTWSAVNIKRIEELTHLGLMQPAGLRAFAARVEEKSGIYAYEQREAAELAPEHQQLFQENEDAWSWFQAAAPSYRKAAIWWVVSAKQEATRRRRLGTLIDSSAQGRRIPMYRPNPGD